MSLKHCRSSKLASVIPHPALTILTIHVAWRRPQAPPVGEDPNHGRLDNEKYTVGCICTLTTEYVAAQVFLDQEHPPPEFTAHHDNNSCTLGRIGEHNIAIAVLPGGEYGTASAARVARDMFHTFPNIRIELMVGIGGGAPTSRHDIRLGDVVVSEPRAGLGGVFQYDLGKKIQDQPFRSTGFLAPPPPVLLTAISGLRAKYEIHGHTIREDIEAILAANKKIRRKYGRPDTTTDRLYNSDVIHSPGEASCPSCSNDGLGLILRTARVEDDDDPAIHYGLIASANQLMKDAKLRDQYADENDVLCFEMEAAGLLNHLPCLVIRGIWDYSDSHKNKEWQGYSAMAAAAYSKALLSQIPPSKVRVEKKISEILPSIQQDIAVLRHKENSRENKIVLDWLTVVHYASRQSECIRTRQAGTGLWLLNSPEYQRWLHSNKRTLFCAGIPGAGKTTLASIVVQDITSRFEKEKNVGVAYLYCDFQQQGRQNADNLLASLLRQLAQGLSSFPDSMQTLYASHKKEGTRPSLNDISRTLESVAAMYSRVFVEVDALDESKCRSTFPSHLSSLQVSTSANVFATSRPIRDDVEEILESVETFQISANSEDIENYIDSHTSELRLLHEKNLDLSKETKAEYRHEIKTIITSVVDGVFLLAQLHLESLIDKTTLYSLNKAVKKLPAGGHALNQAYGETLGRIRSQSNDLRYLAERVLSLLACAERLLTTSELREALAVRQGSAILDENKRECTSIIVSVCAGLVTVDDKTDIIRLVHDTTRKYLRTHMSYIKPQKSRTTPDGPMEDDNMQEEEVAMADAHRTFRIICVTYLSFNVFESGFCQTTAEFEKRLQTNQLYEHAAHNWGHHARQASAKASCRIVIEFLKNSRKMIASSQALLMSTESSWHPRWKQEFSRRMTGLHLAAYFGIEEVMDPLFKGLRDAAARDGSGRTPLFYACMNGQANVVKLLLARGTNFNAKDDSGKTALSHAARQGHEAVVKLLLAVDVVGVDIKDNWGHTPLRLAVEKRHDDIVKLLLAREKVDVNAKDLWGHTPLRSAVERGHEDTAKLLLATEKVDVNAKDLWGQTPLSRASRNRHNTIVKLLRA
ncbi:hypothetical protein LLEC1_02864 [Akanthomyces lecanii]|uniref:Uncharacterized protein n=1 Tax=Cordyceps confragosa TaxID=2714763 RepID=A0A179I3B7_CORDF|nr:hypothetical protein LLEC1_02864 [Akanthomyces lecanii]